MRTLASSISLFLTVTVVHATCPTPPVADSWQNGVGVQYSFPSLVTPPCWAAQSITAIGIDSDIHSTFNQWTYANQAQNGSNVGFYFQPSGPYYVLAQRVVDYSACGVSVAAQTTTGIYEGTNIVAYAQTYFYLGSNSSLGFPNYDEGAGNYHAFIQKVMAHEIGHTMGLDDQPIGGGACGGQTAGESVMNAQCGTNDSANNMPASMLGLPSCDNASVH